MNKQSYSTIWRYLHILQVFISCSVKYVFISKEFNTLKFPCGVIYGV